MFLAVLRVFRGIKGCSGLFQCDPGVFRVLQTPQGKGRTILDLRPLKAITGEGTNTGCEHSLFVFKNCGVRNQAIDHCVCKNNERAEKNEGAAPGHFPSDTLAHPILFEEKQRLLAMCQC